MRTRPKVFLAHKQVHSQAAALLADQLRAVDIDVWLDDCEIEPGDSFLSAMERGVQQCDGGLVLLSEEPLDGYARDEYEAFLTRRRQGKFFIIPVLLCDTAEVPMLLRSTGAVRVDDVPALAAAISAKRVRRSDRRSASGASAALAARSVAALRRELLERDFESVVERADRLLETHPNAGEVRLMRAIGRIGGCGADKLSEETVRRVEADLLVATRDVRSSATAWSLLAIIKRDHYVAASKRVSDPTFDQIKRALRSAGKVDGELLTLVPFSRQAAQLLRRPV